MIDSPPENLIKIGLSSQPIRKKLQAIKISTWDWFLEDGVNLFFVPVMLINFCLGIYFVLSARNSFNDWTTRRI